MLRKDDPYYSALLVEQARLHLGTVMAGQDSEPFFSTMLKIVEVKAYLGYRTLRDKEIHLKGIKDFFYSVYYGLGIKNLDEFIVNAIKSAQKERSKNRYAYNFIDWLKDQDPVFKFPEEFFEFRRVMRLISMDRKKPIKKRVYDYKTVRYLYEVAPHLLKDIGKDRKYKTVEQCYFAEGFSEKKTNLSPIKVFANPTNEQVKEVSEIIFERFGTVKSRVLAFDLISRCSNARSAGIGGSEHPDGDPSAWPDWL